MQYTATEYREFQSELQETIRQLSERRERKKIDETVAKCRLTTNRRDAKDQKYLRPKD